MLRRVWGYVLVMTILCGWASSAVAEGPAVSGLNGKVSILGGNIDGESAGIAAGTLSIPVGEKIGLQFDAAYGELEDDVDAEGVGLHVFTRDPERYLLGVVGTYSVIEDVDVERYALEAEYYTGNFSLTGKIGQQQGDIDTDEFGQVSLRWYPTINMMLSVGGSFAGDDDNYGFVGAEAQVYGALALFANFAVGEDDYDHLLVGARYYFGDEKDLIKRHREDDPSNEVLKGFTETLKEVAEELDSYCPAGYSYMPKPPLDMPKLPLDECGPECALIPVKIAVFDPDVPEGCVPDRFAAVD